MKWYQKLGLSVAIFFVGVLTALGAIFGKQQLSKKQVEDAQALDTLKRERELKLLDDVKDAKVNQIDAETALDHERAEREHEDNVRRIEKEARDETSDDPDKLAVDLFNSIRRPR